jgi:hypothetical protein
MEAKAKQNAAHFFYWRNFPKPFPRVKQFRGAMGPKVER